MVNVAIAGGTGAVGRTIAEVMENHPQHRAIILSRQAPTGDENATGLIVQVDYSNIENLQATLEKNQIHTVISTFGINSNSLGKSQMNLIKAAVASSCTKRFAPSAFAIPYPKEYVDILPQLKDYFGAIKELKNSDLQWTVFVNGIFLDYFAAPYINSYLKPNTFVIDIANKAAAIPGSGDQLVTLTYTFDMARYVVEALDLPEWPEESRIIGDCISWNEFVELAEEVRQTKFTVCYDSEEKLRSFQITELPSHQALYSSFPKERFQWFMSIFELFTVTDISNLAYKGSLNEKFNYIEPLTVRELLSKFWKQSAKHNGGS